MRRRTIGFAAAAAYLLTIVAANWAVSRFGVVPVGFGLVAPCGVYFAGLAFTLRDVTQHQLGVWPVVAVIACGSVISWYVGAGRIALASGLAFAVSESADLAVYTPLRERGPWWGAVLASNTVGLLIDSLLFLWVAFGSLQFLPGQVVGKAWVTLAIVALLALSRRPREAV